MLVYRFIYKISKTKYKRIYFSTYGKTVESIKQRFQQTGYMIYWLILNVLFTTVKEWQIKDEVMQIVPV